MGEGDRLLVSRMKGWLTISISRGGCLGEKLTWERPRDARGDKQCHRHGREKTAKEESNEGEGYMVRE